MIYIVPLTKCVKVPCMVPLNSLISVQNSASFLFSSSSFSSSVPFFFFRQMSDYLDFWKSSQFQHTTTWLLMLYRNIFSKKKIGITETGTFYTNKCVTFLFSSPSSRFWRYSLICLAWFLLRFLIEWSFLVDIDVIFIWIVCCFISLYIFYVCCL